MSAITVDELEQIILQTEVPELSDTGDRIWTRRMAVAMAQLFEERLSSKDNDIERLRKALKPFAKFAGAVFSRNFNSHDDIMELDPGDGDWVALSGGDFFEARRAYIGGDQ